MAFTVQQVTNQLLAQLRALDPAISAEVGTPERKLIEAVAETIAQANSDLEVLNVQHDVDTMVGGRLDAFLALFGFGRQRSVSATGDVTFSKITPATSDIVIPKGMQVIAKQGDSSFPTLAFSTLETRVLATGTISVTVPVICNLPGTIGNIPSNSINTVAGTQTLSGISRVDNATPTVGGLDGEDDATFKIRFKNTVFRNISGTTDQYLALAVASPYVTKANVVGPMSRFQERMQVPIGETENPSVPSNANDDANQTPTYDPAGTVFPHKRTTKKSTVPYSKYAYSYNYYLTNGEFGTDTIFYRPSVDFVFNNTSVNVVEPTITITNLYHPTDNPDGPIKAGDVLLFEHAYMSAASRNKIATTGTKDLLNSVDVYIDGEYASAVASVEIMPGANNNFSATTTVPTYVGNFERDIDGSQPQITNRFQPLFWQPVIGLPDAITINNNLYYAAKYRYKRVDEAGLQDDTFEYYYDPPSGDNDGLLRAHYFLVRDITEHRGTIRSRNGIEWRATFADDTAANGPLIDGAQVGSVPAPATASAGENFTIENYYYDQNIFDLQAIMEKHKQTTTDLLVHQARFRFFKLYITVMYSRASTPTSVDAAIGNSVNNFFKDQYFGSVIQMSDLLQIIHNVPGVDNVRWTGDSKPESLRYNVFTEASTPDRWVKVEEVRADGQTITAIGANTLARKVYDADFFLRDDELASLPNMSATITTGLVIQRRAQNTFNN